MLVRNVHADISGMDGLMPVDMSTVTAIREIEGGCLVKVGGGPVWLELRENFSVMVETLKIEGVRFVWYGLPKDGPGSQDGEGNKQEKDPPPPTE